MGRAPCCDKANVKRGPWSPEEDTTLKNYVHSYGTGGNWIALPHKAGLKRCGKSCRLRWLNYLRPDIKHGGFTEEEDSIICTLYNSIGSRWSVIASHLPGRTDNDVKNYWNTKLKKKLLAGKVISLNNNITTNYTIHPSATPSPVSLTKSENCHNGFSACLNTNSSTLSSSKEASYGQNVNLQRLVADPIHFVLPGCSEMSEFARSSNNNYSTFSSSQDVSSLSGSSSLALDNNYISWSSNGSGVDDGFLMDFGYETPYDILNCFGFQEKPSEIVPN